MPTYTLGLSLSDTSTANPMPLSMLCREITVVLNNHFARYYVHVDETYVVAERSTPHA